MLLWDKWAGCLYFKSGNHPLTASAVPEKGHKILATSDPLHTVRGLRWPKVIPQRRLYGQAVGKARGAWQGWWQAELVKGIKANPVRQSYGKLAESSGPPGPRRETTSLVTISKVQSLRILRGLVKGPFQLAEGHAVPTQSAELSKKGGEPRHLGELPHPSPMAARWRAPSADSAAKGQLTRLQAVV